MEMIRSTIDALQSDLPPAAVKLGMMGTDAVVSIVGDFLKDYEGKVVCDPVMISTRLVCALPGTSCCGYIPVYRIRVLSLADEI